MKATTALSFPATSLLEKAKAFKAIPKKSVEGRDEQIELVLAYLRGEVRAIQVGAAFGITNSGSITSRVGQILIREIKAGSLLIEKAKDPR